MYLPADLAVTVEASIDAATGPGITSAFPEIHVAGAKGTLSRAVIGEGAINGGGPLLKLHVTTGNISIQKVPSFTTEITGLRAEGVAANLP